MTTPPRTPEPAPTVTRKGRQGRPPAMKLVDSGRPLSRRKDEPSSPAPFAHYTQAERDTMDRPVTPPMVKDEDDGAGCCRCVIM